MKDVDLPGVALFAGAAVVLCFAIRGCTQYESKKLDHNDELRSLRMAVEQYANGVSK